MLFNSPGKRKKGKFWPFFHQNTWTLSQQSPDCLAAHIVGSQHSGQDLWSCLESPSAVGAALSRRRPGLSQGVPGGRHVPGIAWPQKGWSQPFGPPSPFQEGRVTSTSPGGPEPEILAVCPPFGVLQFRDSGFCTPKLMSRG